MLLLQDKKIQVKVYGLNGSPIKDITLPHFFSYPVRKDLIRRAFISSLTARIQPQGRDPMAGKRTTAESWGVGFGIARVPRVKGNRYSKASQAAFAPMTVGGRRTHPPRAEKIVWERINRKEKRLAVISAISAASNMKYVKIRGHLVENTPQIPLIVEDSFESLKKASDVREAFKTLGVWKDVLRAYNGRKIRAGKGKMRGRRYKIRKGPLIVVSGMVPVIRAARNFPGVDVVRACDVSVIHLAPGGFPGRLTLWTESSIKVLEERFKNI